MTERLNRTASVTLDASGAGALVFAPGKYAEVWDITHMTTQGNSSAIPVCQVFRGAAGSSLLDTTPRGNSDVSETDINVKAGEFITVTYSGGTPGALMQFNLEGDITRGI